MELSGIIYLTGGIFGALVLLWIVWYVYKFAEMRVQKLPPGPVGLPIVGSALSISKDIHESFAEMIKEYGPICSFTALLKTVIVVGDYQMAKDILSHPLVLGRPPHFFNIVPGEGGFAGRSGKAWEKQKSYIMHSLRNMGLGRNTWNDIIQEAATDFVNFIKSKRGQPVNFMEPVAEYAMTNIAALMFGREFLCNRKNPDIKRLAMGIKIFKEHYQFSNPPVLWPSLLKYFRKFNINEYAAKCNATDIFIQVLKREASKRLNEEGFDPETDLVANYFQCNMEKDSSLEEINSVVEDIVGHLSIFFSASDTGTAPIQWMLLFMAAYPEVQAKVQAEIDEVIGRDNLISFEDWKKFPYSVACIREMLRWVTPVPIYLPRIVERTFEFRGYTIPKDAIVLVNGWLMHRDPKYFQKPNDYIPERFLDCDGKLTKVDGFGPFSFGKRNCPGENISLMVVFQFFTGILQNFTIKTPTGGMPDLKQHYKGIMEPSIQDLCFLER